MRFLRVSSIKAKATCKNGVLKIAIPKSQKVVPKEIKDNSQVKQDFPWQFCYGKQVTGVCHLFLLFNKYGFMLILHRRAFISQT